MLQTLLSSLKTSTSNDADSSRRRSPRRKSDRCVVVIHGQTFPIDNWSAGGLQLMADDRMFGSGQHIEFTLKFKLRNTIIDINHYGYVVRKERQKVAIEFEPLTQTIRRMFQQVIDDRNADDFANSQA